VSCWPPWGGSCAVASDEHDAPPGLKPPSPSPDGPSEAAAHDDLAPPGSSREAGRRLLHGLVALAILVVMVVALLLAVPGLHSVAHTVTRMDGGWLVIAIFLEILSCLGYVLAFLQVFERAPIRFGARVALSELAFNAAVSLGGVSSVAMGGWLLVERGAPLGRVAERSAVLFLLTSAINVITFALAGFALFAGAPGPQGPLLSLLPGAVGTVVFLLVLALPRLIDRGLDRRLPERVRSVLSGTAESIRDTERLLFKPDWRLLGAIGYLWFDIGVLMACFAALGVNAPVAAVVLAYQIAYLSNAIPVPGGIGILDGSLVGMLVIYGVSGTDAAAATLVYHAISLWIPAMWGTLAFLILRRTRRQPLELRPTRTERRRIRASHRGDRSSREPAPTR
jgi:uncharacterized membrane protein YbhN (UPF0104 family)